MNRFKKCFVTIESYQITCDKNREVKSDLDSPKKNGILMTIATPEVFTFYFDSKYIKFFQFVVTNPKPKIFENIPGF